jgi:hypothetical protein
MTQLMGRRAPPPNAAAFDTGAVEELGEGPYDGLSE